MARPKTEAEWRAQPAPWAHLTKEQTDELISAVVAAKTKELRDGIHSLYLTLSTAKEKLECYRATHSGEYVGGVEYTALIRDMKDAQLLAIKLQGKLPNS